MNEYKAEHKGKSAYIAANSIYDAFQEALKIFNVRRQFSHQVRIELLKNGGV